MAMSSWYETTDYAELLCEPKPHPAPEPEIEMCVDVNYTPHKTDCDVGAALDCINDLNKQVFNARGTEEKFCL